MRLDSDTQTWQVLGLYVYADTSSLSHQAKTGMAS